MIPLKNINITDSFTLSYIFGNSKPRVINIEIQEGSETRFKVAFIIWFLGENYSNIGIPINEYIIKNGKLSFDFVDTDGITKLTYNDGVITKVEK